MDPDVIYRLNRAARMVVAMIDHAASFDPPNFDATGRATTAVALWEIFTETEGDAAIDYARRVASEAWVSDALDGVIRA